MIRWIKIFILGVIFWYILTISFGFIIGLLFKDLNFFKSNSNLINFILLPVGIWLSLKINKSYVSQNDLMLNELRSTVEDAYKLNKNDQKRVAINLMNQISTYVSEIEGLPKPSKKVDEICKRQLREAMTKRRNAITSLGTKNPDWIQAALVESFLHCNSGFLEKKNSKMMMDLISDFIRKNTKK